MSYPKYIDRHHRVDLYERKENVQFSAIFGGVRQLKMVIFELLLISKKLQRFRTFEWYFKKQLTIEFIWAKYEEIRKFAIVISFSVLTGTGS